MQLSINYRNNPFILTPKQYKNPTAVSKSSEPKPFTTQIGRRLHGSLARVRNDSGLRRSPIPHHM